MIGVPVTLLIHFPDVAQDGAANSSKPKQPVFVFGSKGLNWLFWKYSVMKKSRAVPKMYSIWRFLNLNTVTVIKERSYEIASSFTVKLNGI